MNKFFKRFIITANRKMLYIVMGIAFIVTTGSALLITNFVSKYSTESKTTVLKYELQQKNDEISKYQAQLKNVIKIRDEYRVNVKKIVQLLYNKDTATGGLTNYKIPSGDESVLLQMKTTISEMNDDLLLMNGVKNYLTARKNFIDSFPFSWPVGGGIPRISAGYGFVEDPFRPGKIRFHAGIDIPGNSKTPILATADGVVEELWTKSSNLGQHPVYGNLVILRHNYGFETYYGHASRFVVKSGEHVRRGEIIGYIGASGHATGPHLHYEIRNNGASINPLKLLSMPY